MITITDVKKAFNGSQALKGISTVFRTGETNLIIGQSGSGKTVLLKTLLGIHSPDSGTIDFDGRIYADLSKDERRELRTEIGMVFQGSALFDSMTVAENVAFPLRMFTTKSRAEINERVDVVLQRVNLIDAQKIAKRNLRRYAKTSCHCSSHREQSEILVLRRTKLRPRSQYRDSYR